MYAPGGMTKMPSLLLIVALVSLGGLPSSVVAQRPAMTPFETVTYNIHHGAGNDDCTARPPSDGAAAGLSCGYDLTRTIRTLASFDADVIALQEVDRFWNRSGQEDQPAIIGAALGMAICYGPNLVHPPDDHSPAPHEYGTLILSRFSIATCRNTLLPRPVGEQRGLLEAVIDVHGSPVRVYNTHLDILPASRTAQARTIATLVPNEPPPLVLMGDFNAGPDAPEMAPLMAMFTDAWRSAGNGPGHTSPATRTTDPARRIDYIFTSTAGVRVRSAEVVVTDETRLVSDHYPVRATLELSPARGVRGR
jgi:endonuclease/exonuclease/phosphatase family metal-dependent hydrolase